MKKNGKKITLSLGILLIILFSCKESSVKLDPDAKDQLIRSFTLEKSDNPALDYDIDAEIDGSTVYFSLPYGTDRTALTPSFKVHGKGLQVDGQWQESGDSTQNFTSPVFYDLVKSNNSRVQYTVVADYGNGDSGTSFKIEFQAALNAGLNATITGVINNDSINLDFPFETNVQSYIPSFTTTETDVVTYDGVILNDGIGPMINPASGGVLRVVYDSGHTEIYTFNVNVENQNYVHVSNTGSVGASGSQSDPLNTIEEAITVAESKGLNEIRIASGTYTLSANLLIEDNISIRGGYDSSDWSFRTYENPISRSGTMCDIGIAGGVSGTVSDYQGTITYDGSSVGNNTILEGVRVSAMAGAANYTTAISVINGAAPTIQFSDLFGSSISDGSALFVKDSSPAVYSSQILGDATSNSIGLFVSDGGDPTVVSSRISNYYFGNPTQGTALLLEGSNPGGGFYNNYIEAKGTTQVSAVRLKSAGGSFINNIFNLMDGMPGDYCFWEEGSGMRPDLLQNNNFSSSNLGIPLYFEANSNSKESAEQINSLGYASSSDNSDYRFLDYNTYISDCGAQYLPPAVAYDGQSLSSIWSYDLYNEPHTDDNNWSRGAVELDYTVLGKEELDIIDTGTDSYDGSWNLLNIREALVIANNEDSVSSIVYPSGSYFVTLTDSLTISSDLNIIGPDADLTLNGSNMYKHFVINDGDSGNEITVYMQNISFINGGTVTTEEGGAIYSSENLYLYDCYFNNNNAVLGGGIYQEDGQLLIANVIFDQNTATGGDGGGAVYVVDGEIIGINMVFTGNQTTGGAANGSAIRLEDSQAAITFSSFSTNSAGGSGAVYSLDSDVQILSSLFVNNAGGLSDYDYSGGSRDLSSSIVETAGNVGQPDSVMGPPGVASTAMPNGSDAIWETPDDNLHAADNIQLMYNFGFESHLITDWPDADGDGNTSEPFPYDLKKAQRVQDTAPEAGAYEGVHVP